MTNHQEGTANYAPRAYRLFRQIVIYISFILVIIWIIYVVTVAYKDPQILCGSDPMTNWVSLCTLGVAIIGGITYYFSSDLQLKVKSQLRRLPALWAASIDSSYTPYFDPEHYIIQNGHYVRIQNNLYDSDNVGLPIVDEKTPLNSFNMRIYKRYWGSALDSNKRWKETNNENDVEAILRGHIVNHSRIVMVGNSCMIVKAYSGEHLLIHKSQYNDFMRDQIHNTPWMNVNKKRKNALDTNLEYMNGIVYFAKKINNSKEPLTIDDSKTMVGKYYNKLINELAMVAFYGRSKDSGILDFNQVIDALINLPSIPYSIVSVTKNLLNLRMEELAAISPLQIQNVILANKLDTMENQTMHILDNIRSKLISQDILNKYKTTEPRLVEAKATLEANVKAPLENLNLTLELISETIRDIMDKNPSISILPTLVRDKNSPLGILIKEYEYDFSTRKLLKDKINSTTKSIKNTLTISQKTRDQIASTNSNIINELQKTGKLMDKVSVQNMLSMMSNLKEAANNSINQFKSSDTIKKIQSLQQNIHNLSQSSKNKYEKLTGPTVDMIHKLHKEVTDIESQLDNTGSKVSSLETDLVKSNSNILLKTSETEKLLKQDEVLRKEMESISTQFDAKVQERNTVDSKIKHIEGDIILVQKELQELNRHIDPITDQYKLDSIKIKEAQLDNSKQELKHTIVEKAKLELLVQSLRNDLDKKRLELETNLKTTKELQGSIEALKVEHETLKNNFASQTMQLATIGSKYAELVAMNEQLQTKLEQEHKEKEQIEQQNLLAIAKMNKDFQEQMQQQFEHQKANQEQHNAELNQLRQTLATAQLDATAMYDKNQQLQATLDGIIAQKTTLESQKLSNDTELNNLRSLVQSGTEELSSIKTKYDQSITSLKQDSERLAQQISSDITREQQEEFLKQKSLLQQRIASLEEQSMQEQEQIQRILNANITKQKELQAKNTELAGQLQRANDMKDQYYHQLMASQKKSSASNTEIARLNGLIERMESDNKALTERLLAEKEQELQQQKADALAAQQAQYEADLENEQLRTTAAAKKAQKLERKMKRQQEISQAAIEAERSKLICSETKQFLLSNFSFNHQIKILVSLSASGKFTKTLYQKDVFDEKFIIDADSKKEIILNKDTLKLLLELGFLFKKIGDDASNKVQQDYNSPLYELNNKLSGLRKQLYNIKNDILILKSIGGNMLCLFNSIYQVLKRHKTINKLIQNMSNCGMTEEKNLLINMIIKIIDLGEIIFTPSDKPNNASTLTVIVKKLDITTSNDQSRFTDAVSFDHNTLRILSKLAYTNFDSENLSSNVSDNLHSYESTILDKLSESKDEAAHKLNKKAEELKFNMQKSINDTSNEVKQSIDNALQPVKQSIDNALQPVRAAVIETKEAFTESFDDIHKDTRERLSVPESQSTISNLLDKAKELASTAASNVASFAEGTQEAFQKTSQSIKKIKDDASTVANNIGDSFTGLSNDIKDFMYTPLELPPEPPAQPSMQPSITNRNTTSNPSSADAFKTRVVDRTTSVNGNTKNVNVLPAMQTTSGIPIGELLKPNLSLSSADDATIKKIFNDLNAFRSQMYDIIYSRKFNDENKETQQAQKNAFANADNNLAAASRILKRRQNAANANMNTITEAWHEDETEPRTEPITNIPSKHYLGYHGKATQA